MKRFTQMIVFNTAALKKSFMLLFLSTAAVFAGVGLFILGPAKMVLSSSSVQTVVKGISNEAFLDVLEQELPYMSQMVQASDRASASFSDLMFQLVTNINPRDPRSFLGRELPGFELYDFEILVAEQNADYRDFFPMESMPPESVRQALAEAERKEESERNQAEERDAQEREFKEVSAPHRNAVFIYHTHNTESWRWVSGSPKPNHAYDSEKNITLVGKKLAEELKKRGVGAVVDDTNYNRLISENPQYTWYHSYALSLKTVQQAMATHDNIRYLFDIHRDSREKEHTTVSIKGKSYARVYFVIGRANPHWEKNLALAERFHERINQMYPGLSKGIIGKGASQGNGEYNQSVSPNSLLIEVGGIDNTLKEVENTATALADVFADLYFDARQVDAAPQTEGSP